MTQAAMNRACKEAGIDINKQTLALNEMVSNGIIAKHTTVDTCVYQLLDSNNTMQLKNLGIEAIVAYELLTKAGSMGLHKDQLIKAVRDSGKVPASTTKQKVAKVLDLMLNDKLVKTIKPSGQKAVQIYMLIDLEPHHSISGHAWFDNGQENLVSELFDGVVSVLRTERYGTMDKILENLRRTDTLRSLPSFGPDEMQQVIDAMILEGLIVTFNYDHDGDSQILYKPNMDQQRVSGCQLLSLFEVPCGRCPIRAQCRMDPVSRISPQSCEYLTNWMAASTTKQAPAKPGRM